MAVPSGKQKPSFTCPRPLFFKYRAIPDTVDCFQYIFSVEINEANFIAKRCHSFDELDHAILLQVGFAFVLCVFTCFECPLNTGVFMGMPIFSASNRFRLRFGSPTVKYTQNVISLPGG